MFKESYGAGMDSTKMDGSIAERHVLGYQENEGFDFFRSDPKLKEEIEKIAAKLVESGFLERTERILGPTERTLEEKMKLAGGYVRERFLEVSFIKNIEEGKTPVEGRNPETERKIDAAIKEVFKMRSAALQVQRIADFNQKKDPEKYSDGITTPFTMRLVTSLKQKFSQKGISAQVIYNPAIFESDNLKTHIDGIRGTDAYVIVILEGKFKFFYLDYTANPRKIASREILKKGVGVEKQSDGSLGPSDSKIRIYIEFEKVADDAVLAQAGNELAGEIFKQYV